MNRHLHDLLAATARRLPNKIAVEDPERDAAISYAALDAVSDRLARLLRQAGVRPGDRVGIFAPKSIGTVAALFAALKAGAAYVPVDPDAPVARGAFIFGDGQVRALFVDRPRADDLRAAVDGPALPVLDDLPDLRTFGADLVLLDGWPDPDRPVPDLAYILYTSGSTGVPKGVAHTHASALSFVDWCSDTFAPVETDRFSSHAPFHFDLSILDLYVPLRHGATLVLLGEDLGKQPLRLAPVISERRISVWYSTPSILRLLVEFGHLERFDWSALRLVLFAGEVFPPKNLLALKVHWPHPRYANLYGPTETNVCTWYEVPADLPPDHAEPFPIGRTCPNDRSRIVDDAGREVAAGDEGELLIAGGTVTAGYWNLPERNRAAFVYDPDGTAWYRTGDLVREAPDGNLLFLGRRDRMVKRRGYRVELGEIEAALYRHPAVHEAAVVALPDEQAGVVIQAFLHTADGRRLSLVQLKRYCADNLPLYMVPDRFSFQASLPKTSTDKVDYQRLKQLA